MSSAACDFDGDRLRRFRRNLMSWYERTARSLPWRESADPYRVWISEIMLQQTTVAAVIPYYERFLSRFPDVGSLAAAPEREVLKLWEGLGYYNRARNLHRAAGVLMEEHGGRFPRTVEPLRNLPGVGRYTAGAIASFAFDRRAPVVEANTLRLHSRLLGYRGNPRSADGQRLLWDFAERILPRKLPGRFNQALMELGSMICTPVEPRCERCPVRSCCRAFEAGAQADIPRAVARQSVEHVVEAAVAIKKKDKYLLRRRGEGERWQGLWDFQRFPIENGHNGASGNRRRDSKRAKITRAVARGVESRVAAETGVSATLREMIAEQAHSVTRYRIRLLCLLAEYRSGKLRRGGGLRWVKPRDFADYPFSASGRKLAQLLCERDGCR